MVRGERDQREGDREERQNRASQEERSHPIRRRPNKGKRRNDSRRERDCPKSPPTSAYLFPLRTSHHTPCLPPRKGDNEKDSNLLVAPANSSRSKISTGSNQYPVLGGPQLVMPLPA